MVREIDLIEQLRDLSLVSEMTPLSVILVILKLTSSVIEKIRGG